ncbi:MAG: class I SAM-dependent methyltransferase [bacterium]|nr:class I SAM-dependent methyltransferase [bacterium]
MPEERLRPEVEIVPHAGVDWSFFVPFGPDVSLLEFGSGNGRVAADLARAVGSVATVAFSDSMLQQVADAGEREGLSNVEGRRLDAELGLPFGDERFDAVLIDRMLVYPGVWAPGVDPDGARTRLLAEARRVLRPGGVLCVGAENALHGRLGLERVFAVLRKSRPRSDGHFLANLEAGAGTAQAHAGTIAEYRALLERAEFRDIRTYAPLPDPVRPQVTLSLDGRGPQRFLFESRIRRNSLKSAVAAFLGRLSVEAGLLPHVLPYYYLLATR